MKLSCHQRQVLIASLWFSLSLALCVDALKCTMGTFHHTHLSGQHVRGYFLLYHVTRHQALSAVHTNDRWHTGIKL